MQAENDAAAGSDAPLLVTLLLDESGSMAAIKDETVQGYNAYLGSLRGLPNPVRFSLLKFDSNRIEEVHVGAAVAEVPDMAPDDFRPGAGTPLLDAAMAAIAATEGLAGKTPGAKVVVVIQTDGHENCSSRHAQADLLAKVKERTAAGWQFAYLGANIDAYDAARACGIAADRTVSYAGGSSDAMFRSLGESTAAYAANASARLAFTDGQKEAAGDAFRRKGGAGLAAGARGGAGRAAADGAVTVGAESRAGDAGRRAGIGLPG